MLSAFVLIVYFTWENYLYFSIDWKKYVKETTWSQISVYIFYYHKAFFLVLTFVRVVSTIYWLFLLTIDFLTQHTHSLKKNKEGSHKSEVFVPIACFSYITITATTTPPRRPKNAHTVSIFITKLIKHLISAPVPRYKLWFQRVFNVQFCYIFVMQVYLYCLQSYIETLWVLISQNWVVWNRYSLKWKTVNR